MRRPGRFGPLLGGDGVTFRFWAPAATEVALVLADGARPMQAKSGGWFEATVATTGPGTRYKFRVDGGMEVPDPGSAFQPDDVSGFGEVIDHAAYEWRYPQWKGRPWRDAVFSEIHIGTFTPAGTFRAAMDKLDHLVETGITALEIMPVAEFPGARNWGYDGVLWYAPDSAYGHPDDFRALIDAAHERGLMVFLDVVYNHFGPEGNYFGGYAPPLFTLDRQTPWGAAIDYRVDEVRAYAIDSALHWLMHYRIDGLRLDAVHAIVEPGEMHLLHELSTAVGTLVKETGRQIHLVLENDDNIATLLDPATEIPSGKYRAQWNDDYHHAWHTLLTREAGGYYADYADAAREKIARALSSGFVYQGEPSPHRKGAPRGQASGELPPAAFVNFLQNHDQIGNRAYGERLTVLAPAPAVEAGLAVTLLAPAPPMLFMGEEWGATEPFPYFCDFAGELADAVRKGRKAEFEAAFANVRDAQPIPDPIDASTADLAKLDWTWRKAPTNAARWQFVRDLLTLRRDRIVPLLAQPGRPIARAAVHDEVLDAGWAFSNGESLRVVANLSDDERPCPPTAQRQSIETVLWGGPLNDRLQPWAVHWSLGPA